MARFEPFLPARDPAYRSNQQETRPIPDRTRQHDSFRLVRDYSTEYFALIHEGSTDRCATGARPVRNRQNTPVSQTKKLKLVAPAFLGKAKRLPAHFSSDRAGKAILTNHELVHPGW